MAQGEKAARGLFRQVVVVAMPGLGAGAQPDAEAYHDRGSHTLGHVSTYVGGLKLSVLGWLGIGNTAEIRGVASADPPAGSHGVMVRVSDGRGPEEALDELVGNAVNTLLAGGVPVHVFGSVAATLGTRSGVTVHEAEPSGSLMEAFVTGFSQQDGGLFIVTPDHREASTGPVGIARRLERFDARLGRLLDLTAEDTLVVVTSLGGDDGSIMVRDGATRELAPVLAYTKAIPSGVDLGTRNTLADVAATVVEVFGLTSATGTGRSFFTELIG